MHTPLHYELAQQVHADALREARQHRLAKVPPQERRATHRVARLLQALRPAPAQPLRPALGLK